MSEPTYSEKQLKEIDLADREFREARADMHGSALHPGDVSDKNIFVGAIVWIAVLVTLKLILEMSTTSALLISCACALTVGLIVYFFETAKAEKQNNRFYWACLKMADTLVWAQTGYTPVHFKTTESSSCMVKIVFFGQTTITVDVSARIFYLYEDRKDPVSSTSKLDLLPSKDISRLQN